VPILKENIMRKFGSAAVAVLVLAFAGAALASGESSQTPGDRHSGHAISLSGKTVQLSRVDVGDTGLTLGDQIAFSDDLLTLNGRPAGIDGGVCTLVRVADATAQSGTMQCDVTYSLKGGQITAGGLVTLTNGGFTGTQAAAITGGTGRFRNAHGESTVEFVRPGEVKVELAIGAFTRAR
jgi:hypothetical protein